MKKPIKPKIPQKIKQKDFEIFIRPEHSKECIHLDVFQKVIQELLPKIQQEVHDKNVTAKDIIIEYVDLFSDGSFDVDGKVCLKNEWYEKELKLYNEKMEIYEEELVEYEKFNKKEQLEKFQKKVKELSEELGISKEERREIP